MFTSSCERENNTVYRYAGDTRSLKNGMTAVRHRIVPLLAGLMLAAAAEGWIAFQAAQSGFGEGGRRLPLFSDPVNGYAVTENYYQMAADGAEFPIRLEETIRYVDLYFAAPLSQDTTVLLYCVSEADAPTDRLCRVERYLTKGSVKGRIVLPRGDWARLSLQIRGDFWLDRLEAGKEIPREELTAAQILEEGNVLRFFILFLLCISGMCEVQDVLKRWRKKKTERYGEPGRAELSPKSPRPRIVYLDAIRVLAACLVIAAHVLQPVQEMAPVGSPIYYALSLGVIVCLTCNPLFIFLSGALLLPDREEGMATFFRGRLSRVAGPLALYSLYYFFFLCASELTAGERFLYILSCLMEGRVEQAPHFWLIYTLLGLYLAAVPLRWMAGHLTESMERALTVLILCLLAVETVSRYAGFSVGISSFLGGWPGVFLLGYLLTRPWMRRYDRLWMAGAVLALLFSVWLSGACEDYYGIIANESIVMTVMAGGVFAALLRAEPFLKPIGRLLRFGSRYSYQVLLIHLFVLARWIYAGMFSSKQPFMVQVIGPVLSCLALSFLLAFVTEHTAMAFFKKMGQAVGRCIVPRQS